MRLQPRMSKSRYLAGLQCSRRLWLGWHDPEPRSEPLPGTVLAVGTDIGIAARLLVPGGVLVDEGPDQHAQEEPADEVKPVAQLPTVEHREPCESRGSRTVLGAPGGEIPPGDSTHIRRDAPRLAVKDDLFFRFDAATLS